jgi:hypothetical protein
MKAVNHTEIINLSSNGEHNTKRDLYVCVKLLRKISLIELLDHKN